MLDGNVYFLYSAVLVAGGVIGFVIAWLAVRILFSEREKRLLSQLADLKQDQATARSRLERMAELKNELIQSRDENAQLLNTITDLEKRQVRLETVIEKERLAADEKIAMLRDVREGIAETHQAVSAGALRENSRAFIDMAQGVFERYIESAKTDFESRNQAVRDIVQPVRETLAKYDQQVRAMERERERAYGGLYQQMQALTEVQTTLQNETGKLVKALQNPHTRGRWGEITLRRVVELAGMVDHCDFYEQPTVGDLNGWQRPDMVVRLPGGRQIVVDAKTPLSAYLEAQESVDNRRQKAKLAAHADQVQAHIRQLGQKKYWKQFTPTPEFVVLFIPGENFFSAALSQNPQLIEHGSAKGVILATPTTLISLLKTIALVWRQETMTANAKTISVLGETLYKRLGSMSDNINALGQNMNACVAAYNRMVGSFERRVFVSARKFSELGATLKDNRELPSMEHVSLRSRTVNLKDKSDG